MDKVTFSKERLKTSVTIDQEVWHQAGRLAHDLKIDKSAALERALADWIARYAGMAPEVDPHAETIAAVRKILDGHPRGAEAIRAVIAALTSR